MYRIFDLKCNDCFHQWTDMVYKNHDIWEIPECPECGRNFVVRLPGGLKNYTAKDPYDYLEGSVPEYKKIFSGPKVSSK